MSSFAARCGLDNAARRASSARTAQLIDAQGLELVRFAWCDMHGMLRGKTLVASAAADAMEAGVGMVSTLLLKDSSDHTAYKIFEADGAAALPGFEFGSNLLLMADPDSFRALPWAHRTGWLQCQPFFTDGQPVALDSRQVLIDALAQLAAAGFGMQCGLEVEFHIYRMDPASADAQLDPARAGWPGLPPEVRMIHPGYHMLSEQWMDMSDEPMRIVQHTAQALGLPLLSLEVEFGPSQVEAVFGVTDALTAADNMVLFRSAVKQALRRAGYHASFMCRPPFPDIMSSGWHLHQSLVDLQTGANRFMRDTPLPGSTPADAQHTLSATGEHFLAGLLAHARGMTPFCTPTINGYARFRPNALAPQCILWGRDNRGAMLRVIGGAGDRATRIENRIGEPAANPYLYIASQIHAGLDGLRRQLTAPPATDSPYAAEAEHLPAYLGDALMHLGSDEALTAGFGAAFTRHFTHVKQAEIARHAQAKDPDDWQRREYFSRL
ncbi:MAG: glutamine synthetase family protein [Polaromonas sp.]|nr:glutamine synthetase family protein [Polaromonas sp.]